jgi:ABC-type Fe3+-hydroxamate transport system substrate-binding protein
VIHDLRRHTFSLDRPPQRVVSLVPSITETLFDLGAGDAVVGVTDFCIFPAELDRPRVGGTKNPRVEEIRALAPDLAHLNLEENLRRHAEAIEEFAPVFVSEPKTTPDVVELIAVLGALHACEERAAERIAQLEEEIARAPREPFTFACPIWKSPWMWCGGDTYVSGLVETAGGRNVLASLNRYPQLDLETVLEMKPDIVFLPDEPYLFLRDDAAQIRGPRVIGPFPGHLFTWHGTRTILGLQFLREAL